MSSDGRWPDRGGPKAGVVVQGCGVPSGRRRWLRTHFFSFIPQKTYNPLDFRPPLTYTYPMADPIARLYIGQPLHERLRTWAKREGRTLRWMAEQALELGLERMQGDKRDTGKPPLMRAQASEKPRSGSGEHSERNLIRGGYSQDEPGF